MRHYFLLAVLVCAVAGSVSCGSSTSPSGSSSSNSGVTSLQITDVKVGTGAEATTGKIVTVHYTLWIYSASAADHRGTRIQSSRDPGGQPFAFTLGSGGVIQGWEQGVPGMRVGGQRTLIIPPSLGYGNSATGNIPPNSTLVFDIELLDVR